MNLQTRICISLIAQKHCYQGFKTKAPHLCIAGEALICRLISSFEIDYIDLLANILAELYGESEAIEYLKFVSSCDPDRHKRREAFEKISCN